jgi:ribosomal protein L1
MQTTDKVRVTAMLPPETDKKLRLFVVHQGTNLSETVEAMILYCIGNRLFINKLTKKEEEIDYPM